MKWVKRKIIDWLRTAQLDDLKELRDNDSDMVVSLSKDSSDSSINMDKSIRFAMLPARGGCVLEIKSWDKKEREWETVSHVIPEGQDVAHTVGQLVSMEMLRR
jgi:hypothetical protein